MDLAEVIDRRETSRRRTRRLVWRDRRSGFERRHRQRGAAAVDASLVFLRDHPATLLAVLGLANLFSVLDLRLTLVALRHGDTESNPLMRYVLGLGPQQAAVAKVGVVLIASLGIWSLRRHRQALLLALFAVAIYGAVVLFEVVSLS